MLRRGFGEQRNLIGEGNDFPIEKSYIKLIFFFLLFNMQGEKLSFVYCLPFVSTTWRTCSVTGNFLFFIFSFGYLYVQGNMRGEDFEGSKEGSRR
jgi:hypothetical protein